LRQELVDQASEHTARLAVIERKDTLARRILVALERPGRACAASMASSATASPPGGRALMEHRDS
jgi:hypothetical protein